MKDREFEPPIYEISQDLLSITFYQQLCMLYIPVWLGLGLTFLLFGNKMINLVLYGTLLWVLLTCYPNVIKSELLCDTKYVFGDHRVPS